MHDSTRCQGVTRTGKQCRNTVSRPDKLCGRCRPPSRSSISFPEPPAAPAASLDAGVSPAVEEPAALDSVFRVASTRVAVMHAAEDDYAQGKVYASLADSYARRAKSGSLAPEDMLSAARFSVQAGHRLRSAMGHWLFNAKLSLYAANPAEAQSCAAQAERCQQMISQLSATAASASEHVASLKRTPKRLGGQRQIRRDMARQSRLYAQQMKRLVQEAESEIERVHDYQSVAAQPRAAAGAARSMAATV